MSSIHPVSNHDEAGFVDSISTPAFNSNWNPLGFPGGANGKESACQCRKHKRQVPSQGWEDPLEEGMATHSSILAWRIPTDRGAWRATVHRIAKS